MKIERWHRNKRYLVIILALYYYPRASMFCDRLSSHALKLLYCGTNELLYAAEYDITATQMVKFDLRRNKPFYHNEKNDDKEAIKCFFLNIAFIDICL